MTFVIRQFPEVEIFVDNIRQKIFTFLTEFQFFENFYFRSTRLDFPLITNKSDVPTIYN